MKSMLKAMKYLGRVSETDDMGFPDENWEISHLKIYPS